MLWWAITLAIRAIIFFMKRIHLIISGDVQGVGYRAWTKRQAKDLGIVGWVKNREDKAVELVGEGEEQDEGRGRVGAVPLIRHLPSQ